MKVAVLLVVAVLGYARAAEICCPNIGCFQDTGIWSGLPLPECQNAQGITLLVFTRSNRNVGQAVTRTSIPSVWSGSKETVYLIHGWNNNKDTAWLHDAKDAILTKDDKNVIIVGWGTGANRANYLLSASNTRVVGAEVRDIKDILQASSSSSLHYCAGHSLGGHTCGHAGQFRSDRGFNRITGLDPAGPAFTNADDRRGLNENCGTAVEAWHTDGKDSINSYGSMKVMGHRDFYPNGADIQPGCINYVLGFEDAALHPEVRDDPLIACSHGRATKYFITSVSNDCFAVSHVCSDTNNMPGSCSTCTNCPKMGYVRGGSRDGIFYLPIKAAEPHC
jgi:hypothetical protein